MTETDPLHKTGRYAVQRRPAPRPWLLTFSIVIALLAIAANVLQYFRNSPSRPVVAIGSRVVTKREYQNDLDQVAGKAVMNRIVYNELIRQAATKAGLMPTPQEIATRITELQEHKANLATGDMDAVRDNVAMAIALENLRIRSVSASEAEITAFYAQHQNLFARPAKVTISLVIAQTAQNAAHAATLLQQDVPDTDIANMSGLRVAGFNGFTVNLDALPPAQRAQIRQTVASMADGDVRTLQAHGLYLIFKERHHQSSSQPSLTTARPAVERLVKLQKAPSAQAELATLYKANPPSFDIAKYQEFFSDLNQPGAPQTPALPKSASR